MPHQIAAEREHRGGTPRRDPGEREHGYQRASARAESETEATRGRVRVRLDGWR